MSTVLDDTATDTAPAGVGRVSRVIGPVFLTLDFTVPVEAVRAETQRILEASPLWDRREWVLQVTEITTQGAELRILGRALGGDGPRRCDLFSYLYFDSEYIEASIGLGRQDAEALFEGVPPDVVPWRIGLQHHLQSVKHRFPLAARSRNQLRQTHLRKLARCQPLGRTFRSRGQWHPPDKAAEGLSGRPE